VTNKSEKNSPVSTGDLLVAEAARSLQVDGGDAKGANRVEQKASGAASARR
jgi:hypothetical protein